MPRKAAAAVNCEFPPLEVNKFIVTHSQLYAGIELYRPIVVALPTRSSEARPRGRLGLALQSLKEQATTSFVSMGPWPWDGHEANDHD